MVGSIARDPGQVGRPSPAAPRRSSRLLKSSGDGKEVSRRESRSVTDTGRQAHKRARRASSTESDSGSTVNVENDTAVGESARALLLRVLDELKDLKTASFKQQEQICRLEREVLDTKEELKRVTEQLKCATRNTATPPTYADVLRTPPDSPASRNVQTFASGGTAPPDTSEALFCTVDVSRVQTDDSSRVTPGAIRSAVQNEIRTEKGLPAWQCRAITTDLKAQQRIRIVCRDEDEHQMIKEILENKLRQGVRVLREEYYPIKVDGVSRSAILDECGRELQELNDSQ